MSHHFDLENIKMALIEIQYVNNDLNTIPSIPGTFDKYKKILNKYGLLHVNWKADQENVKKLIDGINRLAKSEEYKNWLFENICDLDITFAQIQTDNTVPDQGFAMYTHPNRKIGNISSIYAILYELEKIKKKRCKYDGHCTRCNPNHFHNFFHTLSTKPSLKRKRSLGGGSLKKRGLRGGSLKTKKRKWGLRGVPLKTKKRKWGGGFKGCPLKKTGFKGCPLKKTGFKG